MEKFLYKRNTKKNANYNIWMAFPGCYSFALSSLGYLHIFRLMDEMEEVNVERIYSDSTKTAILFKDAPFDTFTLSLSSVTFKELPFMFSVYLVRFLIVISENLPLFVSRTFGALIISFLL